MSAKNFKILKKEYQAGIHSFTTIGNGAANTPLDTIIQQPPLEVFTIKGSNLGLGTSNPIVSLDTNRKDAYKLPSGTTTERPTGVQGYIRYNTESQQFEGFGAGNQWGSLGGVKSVAGDTYILAEYSAGNDDKALHFYTSNIEYMTLNSNGNLGIGSNYPKYKLDVNGDINYSGNSYKNNILQKSFSTITTNGLIGWGGPYYDVTSIPYSASADIISVSAGGGAVLALKNDGSIIGWGNNQYGQVTIPSQASNIIAISIRQFHSLALSSTGRVIAWGYNTFGQSTVPSVASNCIAIAAGGYFSLALQNNGRIIGWGYNNYGQLNIPSVASNIIAISAGTYHGLALNSNGNVIAWGYNGYGQLNIPNNASNIVAISAGDDFSLALTSNGRVIGWGANFYNQLNIPASAQSDVIAISGGEYHSLALKSNGSVIGWGHNSDNQINIPSTAQSGIVAIAAGGPNSFAVKISSNNTYILENIGIGIKTPRSKLDVIGSILISDNVGIGTTIPRQNLDIQGNTIISGNIGIGTTIPKNKIDIQGNAIINGNIGIGTTIPRQKLHIEGNAAIIDKLSISKTEPLYELDVLGDINYSGIVSKNNLTQTSFNNTYKKRTVFGWGYNTAGQTTIPAETSNSIAIAAGWEFTLSLQNNGRVIGWGTNGWNQLYPPNIASNIIAIAAGAYHSLALNSSGNVFGWGRNASGETTIPSVASNIIAIAAGKNNYSLALNSNGNVIGWGDNSYGQINIPTVASNITAISAGFAHSLALTSNGKIIGWGVNNYGQINIPGYASNIIAISAGSHHSLAVNNNGRVFGWGYNSHGQVTIPNTVQSGVIAVAAGGNEYTGFSLALKNDGSVVGWGYNDNGQVTIPELVKNSQSGIISIAAGAYHALALRFQNSNAYILDNIGIGTTINRAPLDVIGNILASENIGIGTTIPRQKLDIYSGNAIISGNLGIGTTTTNVALELHTKDAALLPSGTTTERPTGVQGYIRYNTESQQFEGFGAGNAWGSLGGVKSVTGDTYILAEYTAGNDDKALHFYTSNIEYMTLNSNGNLGIGTNNPIEKLHIVGNVLTTGTLTASNLNVIGEFVTMNTITSNTEQIVVTNDGTGPALKVTQTGNNSVAEFYDNETGVAMIIANNGNIGIGTTTTEYKLHVEGTSYLNGSITTNNNNINAGSGTVTAATFSGTATQVSQYLTRGIYLTGNNYNGSVATEWAVDATSTNTANKVVVRDASGNFSAGTITATTFSGTATQVSQDLTRGTYLTGNNYNGSVATEWAVDASSTNTANKVVVRDASGNFSAGTITASLLGTATQVSQNLTRGTYLTGNNYNGLVATEWSVDATTTATPNKVVVRDEYGNIYAANIGIGTTTPRTTLDVNGNIRTDYQVTTSNLMVLGNLNFGPNTSTLRTNLQINPVRKTIYINTETSNDFYVPIQGTFGGYASNVQVFKNQNILTYYSDTVKNYDVSVLYTASPATSTYKITLTTPATYGDILDIIVWPQIIQESATEPGYVYQQVQITDTYFRPSNTDIYYTFGNVAIGTSNTTLGKMVVAGNIVPSSCNVYDLGTSNLRWRDLYLSGNTIDLGGTLISRNQDDGGLRVHTADGTTSLVNMTLNTIVSSNITVSENIGIGTTIATQKLHVIGNILATGTLTASNISVIGDFVTLNTITSNTEQIVIENAGTGPALKVTQTGDNSVAEFYDNESGLAMIIANKGNIGIGTTNPEAKLHIQGDTYISGNINAGNLGMYRNRIINGNFDIWQRDNTFNVTTNYTYTADRWRITFDGTGATRTITREAFALGQTDVPGEPAYFFRYNQSVAGTGCTYNIVQQLIEGVRTFAGQTVTVSFYAKADATRNILIGFNQFFGSGGSPSASVFTTFASAISISTTWTKYTVTGTLPSISGKTLGINRNDALDLSFGLLLNTTQTIDISKVQVEKGTIATPFEERPYAIELELCKRYYYQLKSKFDIATEINIGTGMFYSTSTVTASFNLTVPLRTQYPTLNMSRGSAVYASTVTLQGNSSDDIYLYRPDLGSKYFTGVRLIDEASAMNPDRFAFYLTGGVGLTTGQCAMVYTSPVNGTYLALEAEL